MPEEWQGVPIPPYRAGALALIDPATGAPTGRYRAIVRGAERPLWDGTPATSGASGPRCPDEATALAEAERYIASFSDGLLDFDSLADQS